MRRAVKHVRLGADLVREVKELAGKLRCGARSAPFAGVLRALAVRGLQSLDPGRSLREQLDIGEVFADFSDRGGARRATGPSLRRKILALVVAAPSEVFTPARLAPLVGAPNRDVVRNTLLALAAKGRIEKLGPGQYRALAAEEMAAPAQPSSARPSPAEEASP